ncbi:MAG: helix-turn-helix domain-containing protein [Pseudonocardiaceae bacterium]
MGSGDDDLLVRLAGNSVPVHPVLLARPEVRVALAGHDIGTVFRVLNENGWSQRGIASAVGMRQSEVSEILRGRRVSDFRVLVRVADGLVIPREWMNLGPADGGGAYPDRGRGRELTEEEVEEMRRRAMMAFAGMAFAGRPLRELGQRPQLPAPAPIPLPSRILGVHVAKVRDLTRKLRETGRTYGSDPQVSSATSATSAWATRLLDIPGDEPIKRALMTAVAELHIHAGWAAFDADLYDRTLHHCTCGLELATVAGDAYLQATALNYAGLATVEHGRPNNGLAMLQFGQLIAMGIPSADELSGVGWRGSQAAVQSCAKAYSATALSLMGDPDGADAKLAMARELLPSAPADLNGDPDYVAARLELERGRLDAAQPLATASARRWESGSQRARTHTGILLATIHVRAGEPDGLRLAHGAIAGVTKLSSHRARRRLDPLASALEARSSTGHRELARMARQVAIAGA